MGYIYWYLLFPEIKTEIYKIFINLFKNINGLIIYYSKFYEK